MANNNINRLDKIICDLLNVTRSEARKLITKGEISIDGEIVKSANARADYSKSVITAFGKDYNYQSKIYIAMNKPKDCVCTSIDDERSVLLLLPDDLFRKDLFCVGRLDIDTTGLLIITNDGDFAHKVISPKNKSPKKYLATLASPLDDAAKNHLINGIELKDGDKVIADSIVYTDDTKTKVEITIRAGKYHQVKRMFGAVDNAVIDLCRLSIGDFALNDDLEIGKSRLMSSDEVNRVLCNFN